MEEHSHMNSPLFGKSLISRRYSVYPGVSDISLSARRHKESHAVDDTKQTCFIEIGLRDVRVTVTYEHRIPSVRACVVYTLVAIAPQRRNQIDIHLV